MQAISGLSLFQRDGIGNRNDVIGRADHVSWDAEAEGVRSGTGREGGREGTLQRQRITRGGPTAGLASERKTKHETAGWRTVSRRLPL